ncbi:BQ5605_C021g09270 [Microbotryum silenes-dioicae]|uniref:BQ5605_C021g09270 protein n=1 Tax=Microbotryum silenes-dioicae TaxID=796604 RepID=A0A2X0MK47_9BASI|nr:BQ5605_C021g09270 [Microbotryum silenes-dioicae]
MKRVGPRASRAKTIIHTSVSLSLPNRRTGDVKTALPIAFLPRETTSIYSHTPHALATQTPDQIAKIDDVPPKHTTPPPTPSKTKYLDPVASALASKLSAINHQLPRFPIVQPQSTAEGKGAKPMKTSTKRRMEKPTTTHKHKHHHIATLEKEAVHPRSSLRLRAVVSTSTSHNIKLVSATATTPHTSSTPVVIPNPKATNPTTKPTTKAGSTAHSKTSKTKTKSTAKPTSYTPRRSPTPTPTSTSKPKSSTKPTKTTRKIVHTTTTPVKVVVTTTPVAHPGESHTGPGRYSPIGEFFYPTSGGMQGSKLTQLRIDHVHQPK